MFFVDLEYSPRRKVITFESPHRGALHCLRDILFIRDLTILGRQRDGDGQNKPLKINGSNRVRTKLESP